MRNYILGFFVLGIVITSCRNTKVGKSQTDHAIVINHVTMQEMVAGVEGQGSSYQFVLHIEMDTANVTVDSLFFYEMKGKVFVKNAAMSIYTARLQAPANSKSKQIGAEEMVHVSFINSDKKLVLEVDSVTTLSKMYMP